MTGSCHHGTPPALPHPLVCALIVMLLSTVLLLGAGGAKASPASRTGEVSGTVQALDGSPVANAAVRFAGTTLGTYTDLDGRFRLTRLPSGERAVLAIDHLGYKAVSRAITLTGASPTLALGTITLEPTAETLASAVYTASRSSAGDGREPVAVSTVSDADLRVAQAQTTAEALREVPGVSIQKTSHGGGHAIVRGLTSNRVLLLVDGIRLNNSTYRLGNHPYLTFVDPLAVGRMEVVRGPGSVLYGSDALGGAVNLITRTAAFTDSGRTARAGLTGRLRTVDGERLVHGSLALSRERWSVFAAGGMDAIGDLRRGEEGGAVMTPDPPEIQHPTGYDVRHALVTARWRPAAHTLLTASYQHTERPEVPRYDKYLAGDYRWLYIDQRRELAYLRLDQRVGWPWLESLHATVSRNRQTEGRSTKDTPLSTRTDEFDEVITTGVDLSGEWQAGRWQGAYGVDGYWDDVHSERRFLAPDGTVGEDARGRYPDGASYRSLGVFGRAERRLGDRLRATLGLRLSRFVTRFDTPGLPFDEVDQEFGAVTGSAGMIAEVMPGVSSWLSLAQGFRAPNLGDMAKLGESKGSTVEVPNPGLDPEELVTLELGVRARTGRVEGEVAVFHSWIGNTIASVPGQWQGNDSLSIGGQDFAVRQKANVGEGVLYGAESAGRVALNDHLWLRGALTWVLGENTTIGEPFDGVPPLTGNAGIVGEWPGAGLRMEPYVRFAATQDRLSPDDRDDPRIPDGGTPGWWTLNLRARLAMGEHGTLTVGLGNLLDRNYRVHGSGINAPGRSVAVTLALTSGAVRF